MSGPAEHDRLAALFESARERAGPDRESFLTEACGQDERLAAKVRDLLACHEGGQSLLRTPAPPIGASEAELRERPPPARIGRYAIERRLGVGGMAEVYLARQEHPRRQVAVKVIRPGLVSRELLKRFDLEAAMLGRLQHPGIARIYEAGTYDDGAGPRPFFAMEYVDGPPLLVYARERRRSDRDRLELFARVCDAVHHAHLRGVVHRDLKPANILIDADGQPKVLDFGIALATESDLRITTLRTDVGQLLGTLPYMSPEQIAGDTRQVDGRTDVYGLGVMLYELLTDRLPYDFRGASLVSAAKSILEQAPAPPSTVNRAYRGDLSTIVLKALEKEPDDRYPSAADLAADLRRFLADRPILARPATTMYHLRKFARRNRPLVIGGGVLALAILAAGALAAASAAVAARAAREANWHAYQANIGGADSALQLNDIVTAEKRLLAVREADRMGWEWRHLASRLDDSAESFGAGEGGRNLLALSPDGMLAATSGVKGPIVWDLPARAPRWKLEAQPSASTRALAFSPDGTRLLSAARGPTRIWDVRTGEALPPLERNPSDATAADWRGELIALGFAKGEVCIWNAATRAILHGGAVAEPTLSVRSLRFSPDGSRFATGGMTLKVWETQTGRLVVETVGPERVVEEVAWHPEGEMLASIGSDGLAGVWNASSGEELFALRGHEGDVVAIAFSPDGRRLATGGADRTLRLWDAGTGEQLAILRGQRSPVQGAHWLPGGEAIVTIGQAAGPVHIWHADAALDPLEVASPPRALALSHDGSRLFTTADSGDVHVLDARTGAVISTLHGRGDEAWALAASADGRILAAGDQGGLIRLWDAGSMVEMPTQAREPGAIVALALSSDARLVASGSSAPEVRVRTTADGVLVRTLATGEPVVSRLAFSPDDRWLATSGWRGVIEVWDLATGRRLARIAENSSAVFGLVFDRERRLVSSHADSTLHVWDVPKGRASVPPVAIPSSPVTIAFGDGGGRLFIGTVSGHIRVWDWDRKEEVLVLRAFAAPVYAMAAGGDRLVASDRKTLRVWDVLPVRERHAPVAAYRRGERGR